MTTNNPHAQTEQNQPIPFTVDFRHRLSDKKADVANNILDLVNTVGCMSIRATSVLDVMAAHLLDSSNAGSTINKYTLYWALQSAINEIRDINAVVNAYVDSQA
jgi:hypothetical protein